MKILKITRDEVETLLMEEFGIKRIEWMKEGGKEPDGEICENFDYIQGELGEVLEINKKKGKL